MRSDQRQRTSLLQRLAYLDCCLWRHDELLALAFACGVVSLAGRKVEPQGYGSLDDAGGEAEQRVQRGVIVVIEHLTAFQY